MILFVRLAVVLALSLVGAAVIYGIHAAFKYTRMIGQIFLGLVYAPPAEEPGPVRGQAMTILDSADREIEALFVDPKEAKAIVLFCPESGAGKESWEKYGYFLPELGYRVLSIDFKNEDTRPEKNDFFQWPTRADVDRLLSTVRWAKKVCPPETPVILFGVSKGADIALAASFCDPSIKAVVADGLFSMKEIFRDYIRKWAPVLVKPNFFGSRTPEWIVRMFASLGFWYCQQTAGTSFIDVEELLKKKHKPLLMIYGRKDSYVPAFHQDYLHRVSRVPSLEKLVVESAGHNEAVVKDRGSYEKAISDFLSKI